MLIRREVRLGDIVGEEGALDVGGGGDSGMEGADEGRTGG